MRRLFWSVLTQRAEHQRICRAGQWHIRCAGMLPSILLTSKLGQYPGERGLILAW